MQSTWPARVLESLPRKLTEKDSKGSTASMDLKTSANGLHGVQAKRASDSLI